MLLALRAQALDQAEKLDFHGECTVPVNPLAVLTDKEQIQQLMRGVWQTTGFRFTILKAGHKTREWCFQDASHIKPSKKSQHQGLGPSIRSRRTVGMERFQCQSHLGASCKDVKEGTQTVKLMTLRLRHQKNHIPYPDRS
ncbi:hypothetical protein PM082_023550 [Marasmius tenuissimus]|nr:hypothetical protein PM082_023550 [Marasmius tenuissimus]